MHIEISHNETEFTREYYEFSYNSSYGTALTRYAIQTRATKRHKWVGDKWDYMDERSYHSKLSRPVAIPEEVQQKLKQKLIEHITAQPLYIGWFNPKFKVK